MNAISGLLINLGNAALWLGGVLKTVFGTLWGWIDALLNPVLSPVLGWLNPICTAIADAAYAVLSPLPTWLGLMLLSAVGGAVLLIAFHYLSNQKAIGRARDDITANLLALKLFKDDLGVAFRSQGRVLGALGRLQWHMLGPLLILLLPMVMVLAQMGLRYQWRPLPAGQRSHIHLHLHPEYAGVYDATLEPSPGVVDPVGPVPGDGELVWRIEAGEPGRHTLRFHIGEATIEKELVVGSPFERVSARRPGSHWTTQLLHPAEHPLASESPVQNIVLDYPGVHSYVVGENWWVLTFFIVSMVTALLLKPVFKTRF